MNILIISQYFWPENFKINDFALSLSQKGHNVAVLTGIPNYPKGEVFPGYGFFKPKKEYLKNIKIYRTLLYPRGNGSGIRLFLNYFSFAFFATIAALLRIKERYDLVFVFEVSPITVGIPAVIYKKIRKVPLYFWVLDLWPESVYASSNLKKGRFEKTIVLLVKWIYRNCDKIYVSSKAFVKSIIEKGIDKNQIGYMPNWVEDEYFQMSSKVNVNEILPQNCFKVMFAGNIGEAQDFESILKAAELLKEHSEIKMCILGEGRKADWLKQTILEKNLNNVLLFGKYPLETMPFFFDNADVMLVSLKEDPIFSLTVPAKIQTYLGCGKPIVAMLNGEGANIINEAGAGLTSNSGDYEGLAKNILNMYHMDKENIRAYSRNSYAYYKENFEKEKIINRIESDLMGNQL